MLPRVCEKLVEMRIESLLSHESKTRIYCLRRDQVMTLPTQSISLAICSRHLPPYFLMTGMTKHEPAATIPRIVNSQPLPIPLIAGSARSVPRKLKMLRMQLLSATPLLAFFGMNSVNLWWISRSQMTVLSDRQTYIVVAAPKMSILPHP